MYVCMYLHLHVCTYVCMYSCSTLHPAPTHTPSSGSQPRAEKIERIKLNRPQRHHFLLSISGTEVPHETGRFSNMIRLLYVPVSVTFSRPFRSLFPSSRAVCFRILPSLPPSLHPRAHLAYLLSAGRGLGYINQVGPRSSVRPKPPWRFRPSSFLPPLPYRSTRGSP